MKKITKFVLSLCMILVAGKAAVAQYNYSTFTAPFQYLTNPDTLSLNTPDWDDDEYYIAIGFPVNAFGTSYDSMVVETNGSVILYNNLTNMWTTTDTLPTLMGFGEFISNNGTGDMRYRSYGNSPISYEISGTPGARIVKVEWRNASFYNSDNNYLDSLDFQVWLFETTGDIEYHYGASYVNPAAYNGAVGPTVGITKFAMSPNYDLLNGYYYLSGDSNNVAVNPNYSQITGTPLNGTVYRFSNQVTVSVADIQETEVAVFPNPASGMVNVKLDAENAGTVAITDLTGRALIFEQVEGTGVVTKRFDISSLAPGMYFVTVNGNATGAKVIVK